MLTAGVEGRVIVAEKWRVFSVSCYVSRSQSIQSLCLNAAKAATDSACKRASQESRLFLCYFTAEVVTGDAAVDDAEGMRADASCSGSISRSDLT